jgi:hypothetical protein
LASIQDHPYAMALDTSQPGHDQRTVRSRAKARPEVARPFMIPQTRPFLIVPCRTFEDALRVAYRFSNAVLACEMPWKSQQAAQRQMLATSSPSHNCPVPDKRRSKNWVETAATWAAYCQLVALWTCRAARSFFETLAVHNC